ncbi:MAG: hypothetical protein K0S20_382, partial [Patescibacteria group bacterium]|nr:hypothetical protein [Patescibacteria group bacterium]
RQEDTVARFGGDEFVVIANHLQSPKDAIKVAKNIIASLKEPLPVAGKTITVKTSIGIALYPLDGTSQEQLVRNADAALYQVKKNRDRGYAFFNPENEKR